MKVLFVMSVGVRVGPSLLSESLYMGCMVKTGPRHLIYKCNKYPMKHFVIAPPLKNWQKGLDLTGTLCYNLCHDKSNTDINCGEFDHTYYRANSGLIPTVVGENT